MIELLNPNSLLMFISCILLTVGPAYSNGELVTWPTGQNMEIIIEDTTTKTTTPEYLDIKWNF